MNKAKWGFALGGVVAITLFAGCASPAKVENMAMSQESAEQYEAGSLSNKVTVTTVSGGKKTNPAWTSEVDSESFKAALIESLDRVGLLTDGTAKYEVSATLEEVKQPLFGINLKVETAVRYVVKNSTTNKTLFDELVAAEFTAGMSDAFAAVKRLRLANEGSIRANIESFVSKLLDQHSK